MFLFVKNELSYDTFHSKSDQIFRVTTIDEALGVSSNNVGITNPRMTIDAKAEIPEVTLSTRLLTQGRTRIENGDDVIYAEDAKYIESSFFDVFDFELVGPQSKEKFEAPRKLILNESLAKKTFRDEDPIGKTLSLPAGHFNPEKMDIIVSGVIKDFSEQSHFHPNLLVMPGPDKIGGWAYTYLLLSPKGNPQVVEDKISQKFTELYSEDDQNEMPVNAYLMHIRELHLNSNLLREIEPNGSMNSIYVFSIAALILLYISLSNFTNLNIGMAVYLRKFLALNQLLGSSKRIIINYFFIESFIIVCCAVCIALVSCIPINSILFEYYQINLLQGNLKFALGIILVFGIFGILAGVQPVIANRFENYTLGDRLKGSSTFYRHKFMLISQFVMAIVLLVGVIVISEQTGFALKNSMAADKNNVVCIPTVHSEVQKDFGLFKAELLRQNAIISVSAMMDAPGGETHDMFPYIMEDLPEEASHKNYIGVFACDYSFADVFGFTFLSGKNFSSNNRDEMEKGEYIINETALNYLGFQDADAVIDKAFGLLSPIEGVHLPMGRIIGVVKDFHLSGLQTKVEPLVLFKRADSWLGNIVVAYNPKLKTEALKNVNSVWSSLFPTYPLEYLEVSSIYKSVYKTELWQRNLIIIFTIISVFVCAMGLIGLSLMVSRRRFKEIGIRKVNGAKISEILFLLNKDFLNWLAIAFVLATPFAFLAANKWLEAFAYKIPMSWWMFVSAGLITTFITIITVS